MATRVYESRVINAPIDKVWGLIRSLDMSKWVDTVASVDMAGGAGEVRSLPRSR